MLSALHKFNVFHEPVKSKIYCMIQILYFIICSYPESMNALHAGIYVRFLGIINIGHSIRQDSYGLGNPKLCIVVHKNRKRCDYDRYKHRHLNSALQCHIRIQLSRCDLRYNPK